MLVSFSPFFITFHCRVTCKRSAFLHQFLLYTNTMVRLRTSTIFLIHCGRKPSKSTVFSFVLGDISGVFTDFIADCGFCYSISLVV